MTIDDIQKEYLPVSKKKIRVLCKKYLPYKMIGGRIFVPREALEQLLYDLERKDLPLH